MQRSLTRTGASSITMQALDGVLLGMLQEVVRTCGREFVVGPLDPRVPADRKRFVQLILEVLALEHGSRSRCPGDGPLAKV